MFALRKLMFGCWNSHFNVTDTFKHVCAQCVWLCEPLTCQISPLYTVSALSWFLTGDDSDYAYAPAANKCGQHTSLILVRGGRMQALWKPTNPYSADRALTLISGWTRGWSGESQWANGLYEQRKELIRRLCPQWSCSSEGGNACSCGAQQLKWTMGLIFELTSKI